MQWNVRFDLHVDLADEELLSLIHEAAALSRVVREIPLKPEIRRKMNRLNIIRAVRGTTGIEGSDLSEGEVEQVLDAPEGQMVLPSSRSRQEMETKNAARVMAFVGVALESEPGRPLTEALICRLHQMTTDGIEYAHNVPGEYRHHAVTALDYSPPRDGTVVRQLMARFVEWLNEPPVSRWHPVVRAVAAHFYLVSIHPFGDGNGRTARAVESYLLYQGHVNDLGFYSLANFYYAERAEYIRMLDFTRFESGGDLTPFVKFASRGLLGELSLIKDEVLAENKKVAFRDFVQDILARPDGPGGQERTRLRMQTLMDLVCLLGSVSESQVKAGRLLQSVYPGAAGLRAFGRDVVSLVEEGLLERRDGELRPNYGVMDRFTRPLFGLPGVARD